MSAQQQDGDLLSNSEKPSSEQHQDTCRQYCSQEIQQELNKSKMLLLWTQLPLSCALATTPDSQPEGCHLSVLILFAMSQALDKEEGMDIDLQEHLARERAEELQVLGSLKSVILRGIQLFPGEIVLKISDVFYFFLPVLPKEKPPVQYWVAVETSHSNTKISKGQDADSLKGKTKTVGCFLLTHEKLFGTQESLFSPLCLQLRRGCGSACKLLCWGRQP